ncbi:hypothetical protein [Paenibacillus glucanolyticus]|uniref:hypothetical protein n=1 Tax=Paenibacillus glucanolyticus TaxID=59843 RepID=UPI00096E04E2|nr:hypothetical protein [Paenibacillus glucanolyticus]OMF74361.1 hypothetical protein BK142_17715 [Paenibacillus glucanolyticus]
MNINNEDIAKQHILDLRQEVERCQLATKWTLTRKTTDHATVAARKADGKWKSLLETIIMMGRRML